MSDVTPSVGDLFLAEAFDPANRADPYGLYARTRAEAPILDAGNGLWLTFDHHLAHTLLRSRHVSSDERRSSFFQANLPNDERFQRYNEREPLMLFMDPPDHTRLRRLVAKAFTPRRIEQLVPRIEELTSGLLAAIEPGASVNVIDAIARPLPVAVICELLGVPGEDEPVFSQWSDALARAVDPGALKTEEESLMIEQAELEIQDYTRELLDRRRRTPGDDLLSSLLAVRDGDDRLTEMELVNLVILLLIAGHETTVNLIGNGIVALARHPEEFARWRADRGLTPGAVDEVLRYDSPVQMGMRVLTEPWDLGADYGDVVVPEGEQVLTLLGAANRDPAMFDRPDEFDITRDNASRNMSFGGGIHHCLGMALARTEGQTVLGGLVDRVSSIDLVAEPDISPRFVLRGYERVEVVFG